MSENLLPQRADLSFANLSDLPYFIKDIPAIPNGLTSPKLLPTAFLYVTKVVWLTHCTLHCIYANLSVQTAIVIIMVLVGIAEEQY
jgi:hypothetical protein